MSATIRSWRKAVLIWLVFLFACLGLLWVSGAFQAEFGEYPDEPSHYVTGLMVRDYLASGAPSPPMRFAENYYLHYPKVALGHYPPLLYAVEALWMLVFPISRPSLLVLNALLVSLAAATLCFAVRKEFGEWAGLGAGLLLTALPLVQRYCDMVMAEPLTLCLTFGALVCYGRYLETERLSDAAWFGILASLALLAKQVTLFLGLVPPLALLLTRRFRLLRRFSFWLPAFLVMGLAMPWYIFSALYFPTRLAILAGYPFSFLPLRSQAAQFFRAGGWALALAFAAGFFVLVLLPPLRGMQVRGRWAAYGGSIAGFLVWQRVAPAAGEGRHLLIVAPVIILFAVAGMDWLARRASKLGIGRRWAWAALSLAIGLVFGLTTFELPQRRYHGFAEAASQLSADPRLRDDVILICSDASGEGAFIAEVAAREKRPGHIVLRGNKMLASMTWSATWYQPLYTTPGDLLKFLESVPVRVLVVETAPGRRRFPHEELTEEMLRLYSDRWRLIGSYPKLRVSSPPGAEVRVYELAAPGGQPRSKIRIDLQGQLKRFLEY